MNQNMTMLLTKGIPAALGGLFAYLFGPWDASIMVLLCVVCLDYITGIIGAAVCKCLDSGVGFMGLLKKVFIFAMVALSALLDQLVPSTHGAIRAAVCMFYIANEGFSILENAGKIGLPLPAPLRSMLTKLQESDVDAK
ncbi:MAG: phage holin family protein [Christensenellaceae bacterium]|jgi:toxin secretion/phage lysis holin|nr:phage holin family protein [Christensenellaceae bacterium]